jgi:2-C-methyl-D-erythritol 2,4-cyclodiphosphate synthase
MVRIGLGYDVHVLVAGRPLVLGGVRVPYHLGLDGHSDADVLAHAVADACLGAARRDDIGKLFPDDDPAFEGADSLDLLRQVAALVRSDGFSIADVDSVLVAQAPKISPYRDEMRANLARALGVDVASVGVKATTTEHLGPIGQGEGMAAYAVALLERHDEEHD